MEDNLDVSDEYTFDQTNFNMAIGLFDIIKGSDVYDKKYMNFTAVMSTYNRLDESSEIRIPVNLRLCTQRDKEEFFPDLSPGFNAIFSSMFCIDDPSSIAF